MALKQFHVKCVFAIGNVMTERSYGTIGLDGDDVQQMWE